MANCKSPASDSSFKSSAGPKAGISRSIFAMPLTIPHAFGSWPQSCWAWGQTSWSQIPNVVTTILQSEVRTIPLVFISVSDPIGSGFVKDLARPGGNVTGFANFQPTMGGKWFEKLHEVAPHVQNVGLVMHPEPPNFGYLGSAETAAASTKLNLVRLDVHNGAEIERALATMASQPDSGLIVAPNVVTFANGALIVALAAAPSFACDLSIRLLYEGGRAAFLRLRCGGPVPARGNIRQQNTPRRNAVRSARSTSDNVRACHKPQDCTDIRGSRFRENSCFSPMN